jgi:hypothetical protein
MPIGINTKVGEYKDYDVSSKEIQKDVTSFFATVTKVLKTESDFLELKKEEDTVVIHNKNSNFSEKDARFYGAILFASQDTQKDIHYAYPIDKNNFTFPIVGETVIILVVNKNEYFYLPYTVTQYPNYRVDYKTKKVTTDKSLEENNKKSSSQSYENVKKTGTTNSSPNSKQDKKEEYNVQEKIKFIKPNEGDTILSGRVGNTIRFSEFFLTEDGKTTSPSIFIRNKQNPELDSKSIGTLVEEDINKDGTSIYLTSNKVKVPFKETIKKQKVGFKEFPSSDKLKGDQLFVNSDRIILSAKASEFIIFGKGNTGVITDGNYSIDAEKEVYIHNKQNITIHSEGANQIFLNSDNGTIYLGKNSGAGDAGAAVQKMVLGGELVKILEELIDAINAQFYLTPAGPSKVAPENQSEFNGIKSKLKTILSAKNYLSKN